MGAATASIGHALSYNLLGLKGGQPVLLEPLDGLLPALLEGVQGLIVQVSLGIGYIEVPAPHQ